MIIILTFVIFVLIFYFSFYSNPKRSVIPQGLKELPFERGFPLIGVAPFVKPNAMLYLKRLAQKHGPIYKLRIGMRDVVVLNNFDTIKKALKEDNNNFLGRIPVQWYLILTKNSGTVFTEGENWANQRHFLQGVIRDLGLGKTKFMEIVQNECRLVLDELTKFDGKSVDFGNFISFHMLNIISKFIMNKRFSRNDQKLRYIEDFLLVIVKRIDYLTWIIVMYPQLNSSPFFNKLMNKILLRDRLSSRAHTIFKQEIEERRNSSDFSSEGEDLIDRFLMKQHEMREKTGTDGVYTDSQMIQNSFELFIAGSETSATLLVWSFFFLSKFPDIQEKVYLEIIDKIGNERMATMSDKKDLIYTQAVMDEILRLGTVVNEAIRRTFEDTNINGYFIPQNTFIIPNVLACHLDPDIWENPWEFRPHRFLNDDSNGNLKYIPREELIPFSMGKRNCLGESLGRMEFFMFLISILQNFKVRFSKDISEKEYRENLIGNDGMIRFSKIRDFIFSLRNEDK